ncbi:MAG: Maf family nucleotide pyrophosphatase [Muribaculaceae bacterium]|nr:Maf family nucleotide pyrophosphatase [Muribaculaceae bacterium]
MLDNLRDYKIYLASKSPRRRELMQLLRIPFTVLTIGGIDESFPEDIPLTEVPQYISESKASVYQKRLNDKELLITADTMVISGDKILGKPRNGEDAVRMLLELSGKTHQVATGVTIVTSTFRKSFTTITDVTFAPITEEEVRYYVNNYQPLDKAGAYGIQEWIGAVAVSGINGSFYNVMGLPVHRLFRELAEIRL